MTRTKTEPVFNLPMPVDNAETVVRLNFWGKLCMTLGRIPFAEDAVAAWFCAADPETPTRVKAILLGALGYFILPVDLIPDALLGVGFTDDAAVIAAALTAVGSAITDEHRAKAKRALLKA
jgi:uncharacterized membrane protein YkvA (DUF1232 family)